MIIIEEQSSLRKRAKFSRRILRSSRRIVLSLMPNELTPWLNQLFCVEGTKVIYLNSGVKQKGDECRFPHSLSCQSHELEWSTCKNWCYGEFKTRASCCYTFLSWNLFTTALRKTFQQALYRVTLKVETCSGTLKLVSKCCFRRPFCFGRRRLQWVKAELFHFLIGLRSVA